MRHVCWLILASIIQLVVLADVVRAEAPKWATCECEQSACAACEVETGVTFYSAKCGVNESRVKSCKKPTCVAVEDQKACLAKLGLAAPTPVVAATAQPTREPASSSGGIAGEITHFEGLAQVIRATGPVEKPREGLVVNVGDRVETKANGKIKILLKDGSEMIVAASSSVRVDLMKVDDTAKSRQVLVNLLSGKVRNRVHKKYDGDNSFKVKTRSAVAGVRGTDFVASYTAGEKDKEWVSEIRTFEGLVRLEDAERPGKKDARPPKTVDVPAGTYASLVIARPVRPDDEDEFFRAIESGFATPVMKMKDEELKELNEATDFVATKKTGDEASRGTAAVAAAGDEICSEPRGKFKQCSYSCEGNPAGEKKCRMDLEGVSCVRRICNGNGFWTEPRRMPASESGQCQSSKVQVKDCENYW